jgi:hypothetical protein
MSYLGKLAYSFKKKFLPHTLFKNSEDYWVSRYKQGGNSGAGSYNNLAEFKSEIINDFVDKNKIETIIEFGCGDGNQLKYFKLPSYKGFDISSEIIEKCQSEFKTDKTKQFFLMKDASKHQADLVLSLDVIYHLVEEETYHSYMNQLFESALSFIIIYSCDFEDKNYTLHVKPRKFTDWVKKNQPDFELQEFIPNKFPKIKGQEGSTSFADFFIYQRISV